MHNVIRVDPDRLDLEIGGRLDRDAMVALLDLFVARSEGIEHGVMLYRIHDMDLPSLGALAVELSRLPLLLRTVRRFDRIAVVADAAWVRRVGELEGALLPGLEIRGFAPEHAGDAQTWLRSARD
ncbi:STAS/SEC14 domain-containing protein [Luteimonas deserti]|uniref:STAS/SEC14 domain-containing protein n=1 Tax=Luteimonas deserti TaxID=2752306 RepID=A0A7Z0QR85_9GAMM|nr:STAS/SEC14 domain-containing protein [Luteimonas deserti]NYZ62669.1 STAS/SEC14 domain-containing protein [Luteimonas deserti]